jgi:hypothetical protein
LRSLEAKRIFGVQPGNGLGRPKAIGIIASFEAQMEQKST